MPCAAGVVRSENDEVILARSIRCNVDLSQEQKLAGVLMLKRSVNCAELN